MALAIFDARGRSLVCRQSSRPSLGGEAGGVAPPASSHGLSIVQGGGKWRAPPSRSAGPQGGKPDCQSAGDDQGQHELEERRDGGHFQEANRRASVFILSAKRPRGPPGGRVASYRDYAADCVTVRLAPSSSALAWPPAPRELRRGALEVAYQSDQTIDPEGRTPHDLSSMARHGRKASGHKNPQRHLFSGLRLSQTDV
jgi:hypothetical protein